MAENPGTKPASPIEESQPDRLAIIAMYVLMSMENPNVGVAADTGEVTLPDGAEKAALEKKILPAFKHQVEQITDLDSLRGYLSEKMKAAIPLDEVKNYGQAFAAVRGFLSELDLESYPTGEVCDFNAVVGIVS